MYASGSSREMHQMGSPDSTQYSSNSIDINCLLASERVADWRAATERVLESSRKKRIAKVDDLDPCDCDCLDCLDLKDRADGPAQIGGPALSSERSTDLLSFGVPLQRMIRSMMSDDTDDSGELLLDGPFDPDAQATVTDFIDYTEYLPADLIRSLTLIRQLDERYLAAAQSVHELTKAYGQLPDIPAESRPDVRALRKEISRQLDRAINARESSYAESCRLYDVVDRHFDRLDCIKKKLHALPKPPSREPTPAPAPVSPENKRSRTGRKGEDGASTTRITLRVDGQDQKSRSRRSLLTGGHGFNPDSPIASTEQSDVETEAKEGSLADKKGKPKKEKQPKRPRASRPPGMGTNVHSSVAGISTSNALALLKPPPEDAKMGSEDLPWLRLTEWEMTKLRKKMKKNAVWQPSEIMIHRELALRGRGWEGYRAAKAAAEANGTEFVDCDDIMNNYVPGKLIRKTEAGGEAPAVEETTKLSNRGMKLNEAKKLKRETLAREQAALAAAEAELAAKRLGDIGSTFKSLFGTPADGSNGSPGQPGGSQKPNGAAGKEKEKSKTPRKRKLDETTASEPSAPPQDTEVKSAKKRKPSKSTPVATNVEEPVAQENNPAAPEPETSAAPAPTPAPAPSIPSKKSSPVPSTKAPTPPAASSVPPASEPVAVPAAPAAAPVSKPTTTPTPPTTRPPSRRRSVARSVEPVSSTIHIGLREGLRRKSATPAKTPVPEPVRPPSAPATTAASRRSKRPAPGPVSSGQDGGAAVSYGRRKAKPAKKKATSREPGHKESSVAPKEDVRIDEDGVLEEIDPNEPRYCLCGDVSFGTMICCENNDCDKEWFHLDCVGLSEVPSRTAKWYCPDCRVKLGKGPDGIVKVGSRR
ncbi:PHD finger domain protein, putative [Paecilomyces variotii No. 5]|uniref:Chromatin modification-related protein n=1 Tax=Byssochlamys spectabilis (strain No. 5 / NBRC 109023) TaxID=1356009 RepID=V5G3V4_BYSSN|nr:PHD finger domain protein, putative [Paecilomyces variotii No. 5]